MEWYDELPLFTGPLLRFDQSILDSTERFVEMDGPIKPLQKPPARWDYTEAAILPAEPKIRFRDE
jgi:hypothetical protein